MALDVYKDWLGIPEGPRPPDYYELLRLVQFEDDAEKIRKHYKKLNGEVRKYATGKYSVESQNLLNELAKAMLCLTDPQRKREYDESLGRTFDEETDAFGRTPMGKLLVQEQTITAEQLQEAESFADARGLSIRDALVQMKLVDATTAAKALAQELGLPFVDVSEMTPDDSVLDHVPRLVVKRHTILPLFVDDDMVLVACAHEPTAELEDELRLRFEMPMRAAIATPLAINQGIAKYYGAGMRDESVAQATVAAPKVRKKKSPAQRKTMEQLTPDEQRERKQLGYMIICWSIVAAVLFDQYLVRPTLFPTWSMLYLTTFIAAPLAVWYVVKVYWK